MRRQNGTTLHIAARLGSVDIFKSLLDEGRSVNLTDTNETHRYMFLLNLAIWKQRKFWLKEVLL